MNMKTTGGRILDFGLCKCMAILKCSSIRNNTNAMADSRKLKSSKRGNVVCIFQSTTTEGACEVEGVKSILQGVADFAEQD